MEHIAGDTGSLLCALYDVLNVNACKQCKNTNIIQICFQLTFNIYMDFFKGKMTSKRPQFSLLRQGICNTFFSNFRDPLPKN